jgi:DNA-binding MarR family transcriptional regulator
VPTDPPQNLEPFLALALANSFAWSLVKREFEAERLETYMWGLLVHIDAHGEATPSQLAAETGVTHTTIRDQVQSLVDRKLVVRRPNPEDGRSYRLRLTSRGRDNLERGLAASVRAQRLLEEELGHSLDVFREEVLAFTRAAARALERDPVTS